MKRKLTALLAVSALLASSAVSCGKDEPVESSVPDFPELSATESETEPAEESETEAATEAETEAETAEITSAVTTGTTETSTKTTKTEKTEKTEDSESSDESAPDESESNVQNDDNTDSQPDEPADDTEPVTDSPEEPPEQQQSVVFSSDMLNSDAGTVVFELGGDPDVQTAPACFSNGADSKTYTYDGLVLQCYVLEGSEYIYAFTITGGGYTSEYGITVGSSRSDVELYYGAGEVSGNDVMYIYDNYDMTITYDGDTVTAIDFYAPV
ncbi:MAG: hypothetical protein K2J37_07480 [Ruminococcus sp.]|nr:hypothetical protein [Ruminococcus sp.]MDE6783841.1 hypothetical protein [Ruminococcus sp.]